MKAYILTEPGGPDSLLLHELPTPVPQRGEVLIKVKAISINPVDIKVRKGAALYNSLKDTPPIILGWDVSGDVIAAGEGSTSFKKGDEVFGMIRFPGHGKAYAEYVAVPEDHITHKPSSLSHEEAAASTLALLTAWQVIMYELALQHGEKLLMHAAAGGVGHFGVQVAKHLGAYVVGTASEANEDFVKSLGADEFIDYTKSSFEENIRDMDAVFDAVGGDNPKRSLSCLKEGSRMVAIAGGITEEVKALAAERAIKAWPYLVKSSGRDMKTIAGLLSEGVLRPVVSQRFLFENLKEAHKQIDTGRTRGKVVVSL